MDYKALMLDITEDHVDTMKMNNKRHKQKVISKLHDLREHVSERLAMILEVQLLHYTPERQRALMELEDIWNMIPLSNEIDGLS